MNWLAKQDNTVSKPVRKKEFNTRGESYWRLLFQLSLVESKSELRLLMCIQKSASNIILLVVLSLEKAYLTEEKISFDLIDS